MRFVLELSAIERGRAYCICRKLLGEWGGPLRIVFDPEDPLTPPTLDFAR